MQAQWQCFHSITVYFSNFQVAGCHGESGTSCCYSIINSLTSLVRVWVNVQTWWLQSARACLILSSRLILAETVSEFRPIELKRHLVVPPLGSEPKSRGRPSRRTYFRRISALRVGQKFRVSRNWRSRPIRTPVYSVSERGTRSELVRNWRAHHRSEDWFISEVKLSPRI